MTNWNEVTFTFKSTDFSLLLKKLRFILVKTWARKAKTRTENWLILLQDINFLLLSTPDIVPWVWWGNFPSALLNENIVESYSGKGLLHVQGVVQSGQKGVRGSRTAPSLLSVPTLHSVFTENSEGCWRQESRKITFILVKKHLLSSCHSKPTSGQVLCRHHYKLPSKSAEQMSYWNDWMVTKYVSFL